MSTVIFNFPLRMTLGQTYGPVQGKQRLPGNRSD